MKNPSPLVIQLLPASDFKNAKQQLVCKTMWLPKRFEAGSDQQHEVA